MTYKSIPSSNIVDMSPSAIRSPKTFVMGGSLKTLTQLIKSLFSNNEVGFAYDPNDLTTLYQDAAGTIPVTTAGQPVGLMLDKSKGLTVGAELNATALPKITGNAPVATYNSTTKVGTVNRVDVSNQSFIILSSAVGGKWYYVSVKNTGLSQIALRNSNNFGVDTTIANISPNGTFTGYVYVATNYVLGIASALGEGTFIVNTVKEIAGNHAYQTVSASRPILRQTPILGNELVVNGDGSDGVSSWITSISTLTNNAGVFSLTAAGQFGKVTNIVNLVVGKTYSLSIDVVSNTANAPVNVIARKQTAAENYGVIQITSAKQYSFLFTPTEASTRIIVEHGAATPTGSIVFDNVSVRELQGYSTDQNYLEFDGVDDFLQTNSIDFTATDKISLFAGVRKLSDATRAIVVELAASTTIGTFRLEAPNTPRIGNVLYSSGGSQVGAGIASIDNLNTPISMVVTGKSSIVHDIAGLKINGVLVAQGTQDQGTGTYGSYPLYIGRRGGTSLPFNGHLYGLIGIGRLTTDSETIALEKSIAKNTGVTLNV